MDYFISQNDKKVDTFFIREQQWMRFRPWRTRMTVFLTTSWALAYGSSTFCFLNFLTKLIQARLRSESGQLKMKRSWKINNISLPHRDLVDFSFAYTTVNFFSTNHQIASIDKLHVINLQVGSKFHNSPSTCLRISKDNTVAISRKSMNRTKNTITHPTKCFRLKNKLLKSSLKKNLPMEKKDSPVMIPIQKFCFLLVPN